MAGCSNDRMSRRGSAFRRKVGQVTQAFPLRVSLLGEVEPLDVSYHSGLPLAEGDPVVLIEVSRNQWIVYRRLTDEPVKRGGPNVDRPAVNIIGDGEAPIYPGLIQSADLQTARSGV